MKVLVIGAHVDDAQLGAGGAIARHVEQGDEVTIATLSITYDSVDLSKEFYKACEYQKTKVVVQDFATRDFAKYRQAILQKLIDLKSDLVYTHSSTDTHQDHQVVHEECKRAFKKTNLLGYELPWNQRVFNKNYFVSLTEDQLKNKVAALLQFYKSQEHRPYMNADFIRGNAIVNGIISGTKYAEAFEVINLIL